MNGLPPPTEAQEALVLVAWLRLQGLKFFHCPNETGRDPYALRRAVRMKQQGVSRGVPDYFVLIPPARARYGEGMLVAVEMKRTKGSVVSPDQREWIDALNSLNPTIAATVAKGAEVAIAQIQALMKEV